MASQTLLLLPGDGIGTEIMAEVEKLIGWQARSSIHISTKG